MLHVQFKDLVGNCYRHTLQVPGPVHAMSWSYTEETLLIQRVGLTPNVPCLQRTSWMQVWVGVDDWGLIPSNGVDTADGMFSNSRGWKVGTSESLLVLFEAVR